MSISPSFRAYVLEQLGRGLRGVRGKAMFGGVGIYAEEVFFALIADDALYFKVDDSNRIDFETRGMEPFRPYGEDGEVDGVLLCPGGGARRPRRVCARGRKRRSSWPAERRARPLAAGAPEWVCNYESCDLDRWCDGPRLACGRPRSARLSPRTPAGVVCYRGGCGDGIVSDCASGQLRPCSVRGALGIIPLECHDGHGLRSH